MKPGISTSLRPRKEQQKTREILSFTNAAVQALTDPTAQEKQKPKSVSTVAKQRLFTQANGSSSDPSFSSHETSLSSDQRAVFKLGADLSSSSSSQSLPGQGTSDGVDLSSLDSSFNKSTAVRVRVSSRMLREIKTPLDRSVDRNVDRSAVSGNVADPQPTPRVVRHVNGPSAWVSMATSSPVPEHDVTIDRVPTSVTTVSTHEIIKAKDLDTEWKENQNPIARGASVPHHKAQSPREAFLEDNRQDQPKDQVKTTSDFKSHDGIGLCQGEPVTGVFTSNEGRRDSVKAKSFILSQRERALKEEFTKRQDRRSAPIKRSVQPTIIPTKETPKTTSHGVESQPVSASSENHVANAAAIAAAAASAATVPLLQVDARLRKLEELQQQLLNVQSYQMNQKPEHPSHVPYSNVGHGVVQSEASMSSARSGFAQVSDIPANMEPRYPQVSAAHHYSLPSYPPSMHQPPPSQPIPSHVEGHAQNPFPSNIRQPSFTHQTAQNQPVLWHGTAHYQNPVPSSVSQPFFTNEPVPSHATMTYQNPVSSSVTQPSFTDHPVPSHATMNYQNPVPSSVTRPSFTNEPVPSHITSQYQNPVSSNEILTRRSIPPHATSQYQNPVSNEILKHRPIKSHATTTQHHTSITSNIAKQPFTHQPVQTRPTATCTETVYTQTLPSSYVPAKKLLQQETSSKFKAVKNSKTQTSPQDSSLSSSDSPLQTPLPRKKPPRPTPHSNAKDLKYLELPTQQKRVHFDASDHQDPFLSYSKYAPKEYTGGQRFQSGRNHQVGSTTKPYSGTTTTSRERKPQLLNTSE